MSAAKAPPGKAMYVAAQADVAWLRNEQQKLHTRSMKSPFFAGTSMESPVHNERCTPGSGGGARKPAG